jgi:hypothetical protein
MKTFKDYLQEELDLSTHPEKQGQGIYNQTFAGKNSADKFHHKVNSSAGSKVINRTTHRAPGIGLMHVIHYQGKLVEK